MWSIHIMGYYSATKGNKKPEHTTWINLQNLMLNERSHMQKTNSLPPVRLCCLQETHVRPRDTYRLKVRGWKKIFHANGNQKKAGVAIFISDKIDFKDY